jgi:hypothetical protein
MYFANGEVSAMESEKPDNCAETRLAQPPNGMESEGENQYNCFTPVKTLEAQTGPLTPEEKLAIGALALPS